MVGDVDPRLGGLKLASLLSVPELIYKFLEKVQIIRNILKIAYSWKKSYVDNRRGVKF